MFNSIIEFIKELYGTNEFIPLHAPVLDGNEEKYLSETIRSTFISSVGKFVVDFEGDLAKYSRAKRAIAISNGTMALHLALVEAGVRNGDEVLTQALSFVATANAITYAGGKPVFLDVDRRTMGLSPESLRIFLEQHAVVKDGQCINRSSGKQIKACVPMHTFGHPCEIDKIIEICREYNIMVVEDAAESIGSTYKGKHAGTFGEMGCISFNGNKTITCGGGGAILTNNDEVADHLKKLSTTAKVPHPWEYSHDELGYNYRMPNLNAAVAVAQLERLDEIVANKRETAQQYANYFDSMNGVTFFKEPEDCRSNYWLNVVLLENRAARDKFLQQTNDGGVMTRPVWNLLNTLPMYQDCQADGLEDSKWLADRVVNIPSSYRING